MKAVAGSGIGKVNWLFEALEWIAMNIARTNETKRLSIINMSLGVKDLEHELDFMEVCLGNIPAVIVTSAGNDNTDACDQIPSRFPNVITVGGTDQDDKMFYISSTYASNYGRCVDIIAPGEGIISASNRSRESEDTLSGSSMSAGYVSGVVARLLECDSYQPNSSHVLEWLQWIATHRRTNAEDTHTPDLLLYAACGTWSVPRVKGPPLTTTTSTTMSTTRVTQPPSTRASTTLPSTQPTLPTTTVILPPSTISTTGTQPSFHPTLSPRIITQITTSTQSSTEPTLSVSNTDSQPTAPNSPQKQVADFDSQATVTVAVVIVVVLVVLVGAAVLIIYVYRRQKQANCVGNQNILVTEAD